jgi:hypothetical protein
MSSSYQLGCGNKRVFWYWASFLEGHGFADVLYLSAMCLVTCSYSLHMQDMAVASSPADRPLTSRYRWISLVEIALGTFFVIGHNVFHWTEPLT